MAEKRSVASLLEGLGQHDTLLPSAYSYYMTHEHGTAPADDAVGVAVGLVRVQVAQGARGQVRNDVILEMAIAAVTDTLYVYIDEQDKATSLQYTSMLLDLTWDLACTQNKPHLKINILSPQTSQREAAWDDMFFLPELGAVFGDHPSLSHDTKWLPRGELLPLAYRSPKLVLCKYLTPGISYFDDEDGTGLHAITIVNGTFDHLHSGHKKLLSVAASASRERLVVGITAAQDLLDGKSFADLIEPLETRKRRVQDFVSSINASIEIEFIDVTTASGVAESYVDIRALLVISSSDFAIHSQSRARRDALGLTQLLLRVVRRTGRSTLSSSRIREKLARKAHEAP